MLRKLSALAIVAAIVPTALYACSSDSSSPSGGSDAATGADTSATPDGGGGTDSSSQKDTSVGKDPVPCTQADFDKPCLAPNGGSCLTSTQVDVSFPMTGTPAQYVNRCVKIKVGTMIDFNGAFASHPLEPKGGDTPSPITLTSTGTDRNITFTTAGTFGFQCQFHPGVMNGAIQVVP